MTSEDLEPWSVGKRWERRMQLLVLREQLAKKTRDEDVLLESATPEEQERWVDDITSRWAAIHQMYDELDAARGYPDGDSCCVVHDEPVFGMNNAPDIDRLLYHYTPAKNLPKIRSTMSLRFGPLSGMNDPHESLETHAFSTGLMGPAGEPLVLTEEESASFASGDWIAEINGSRRKVKVGAFTVDVLPALDDVEVDAAGTIVPYRLFASRGFAHPRMWAQYACNGRGVCLVLDWQRLEEAISRSVNDSCPWGRGPVTYQEAVSELSLGFFDARDLVRHGAEHALLKNFEPSLLTKHADWSNEAEYRYFVMDGTEQAWSVPIDGEVVVGLVLGHAFGGDDNYDELVEFCEAFGITAKVRLLQWTHGRPHLARVVVR